MEYDRDFQTAAATRLPVPLISTHALLGLCGLMAWGFYMVTDAEQLAWATIADVGLVAILGFPSWQRADRRLSRLRGPGTHRYPGCR